jgi:ribosomal protein S18 acetylase RimI-like enzyme
MSDIRIRTATRADADTIVEFNVAMADETEGRQLDRDTVARGVDRAMTDSRLGVYYLAERDGRAVGQLLVTTELSDWRDGVFWWVQSVYVHPDARGIGVYRALYDEVVRLARQNPGVCGLRLYVDRSNTAAQEVYRRLGMRRTEYDLYEVDWSGS